MKLRIDADIAAAPLALAAGVFAVGNGLTMLMSPLWWYWTVPGVALTGGYNPHFIRDIGLIYLMSGGAVIAGLARKAHRALLWSMAAMWLCAHAIFHIAEVATGVCGLDAIPRDFLGVYLPGIVVGVLAVRASRDQRHAS